MAMTRPFILLLSIAISLSAGTPVWKWKVVDSLSHPHDRFTQGLFWSGSDLYESTGLVGQSRVYHMNAKGKVLDSTEIPAPHFGEGSARVGDQLLVLTWQSRIGFVLHAKTLQKLGEFSLPGEGWGLASDAGNLWLSDGSATLFRMNAATKSIVGTLPVKEQGRPVAKLNELEVVGPFVLANIWYSDSIAVIAPADGHVVAWIDCASLTKAVRKTDAHADVLNGIAWDGKKLWVTGKLWPKIFALEVSGIPKPQK